MSYTKTNWTDGTTPVDASNLNKIEDALVDQDSRIDANTDLIGGSPRYTTFAMDANTFTAECLYNTGNSQNVRIAIVSFAGMNSNRYGTYIVSGYGMSSSGGTTRMRASQLCSGTSDITIEVSFTDNAFYIKKDSSTSYAIYVSILMLYGDLPTITLS